MQLPVKELPSTPALFLTLLFSRQAQLQNRLFLPPQLIACWPPGPSAECCHLLLSLVPGKKYIYYRMVVDQQLRQAPLNERSVHSPWGKKKDLKNDFCATVLPPLTLQCSSSEEANRREIEEQVTNGHKEWMDEDSEDKGSHKLNGVKRRSKLRVGRKKQTKQPWQCY